MGLQVTIVGMENVQAQVQRLIRGSVAMGKADYVVGSRLPYGYGQEFGRHRLNGRLARRGGGALFLTRAKAVVLSDGQRDLSEGLKIVTAPGPWMLRRLGRWIRRQARAFAPVGSGKDKHPGRLRKSLVVVNRAR